MVSTDTEKRITYQRLFWLFIAGSLIGVVMEGVFCAIRYGRWETHTVAIWGPFCVIYGIGAALLYVGAVKLENKGILAQLVVFSAVATAVEFLCGALLKYGLHMIAWDYTGLFMNIDGIVCLKFSVIWGVAGVLFTKWITPLLDNLFSGMSGKGWSICCKAFSLFMAVNLVLTSACIIRWTQRHHEIPARNAVEEYIDEAWNDSRMQSRFCEWRFID